MDIKRGFKKVLVTGGLGFIGSHTVVELQEKGYEVIIIDDLSNTSVGVCNRIAGITSKKPLFEQFDLKDRCKVASFFRKHSDIEGVIHFAASKAVGESVNNPLLYYENNITPLIYLLKEIVKKDRFRFIFSSSCTVYGQADKLPITENAPIKTAESPYGNTKQICEEIILDTCKAQKNVQAISLRYFNPIGAHDTADIGELPLGEPQNLVPLITQTGSGLRDGLVVFGDDYPTDDGTCVRDYIHVVDLAKAHVVALERLFDNKNRNNYEVFNLGTGIGNSVMQVIRTFEKVSGNKINYRVGSRRKGDVATAYADTSKSNNTLGWKAERTLEDALVDAWKWQQTLKS